jgi:putative ABC transport system permease protein
MTLIMVGGGVTGLLLVGGFFARMFWGLRESTINDGLGHIQIFTAEHFNREEKHVLDTGIDNWRQVAASVSTGGHVRGIAPRIEFNGMLSNGVKSSVFMGSAVDPVAEQSLGFTPHLDAGRDLDSKSGGEIEALIGAGVARSMSVKPGDGLTLLAVTSDGALNGIDVQVVGIVNTGFKEMDDRYLRITLPSAQRLLQSNRVTNLVVGLDNTDNTDLSTIFVFLGIIVFFMVLMSSVNTLLMAMFERTREIGTMLAMGTPRSWIMALFVIEATLLGLLGAVVGVAGGNLLGVLINHAGIHLPAPPGTTVPMTFRVMHVPSLMIGSSILVIVSLALASILPAIRASRLQIAEALAHV